MTTPKRKRKKPTSNDVTESLAASTDAAINTYIVFEAAQTIADVATGLATGAADVAGDVISGAADIAGDILSDL